MNCKFSLTSSALMMTTIVSVAVAFQQQQNYRINHRPTRISRTPTTIQRNMFTGIVEEMGEVVSLEERDDMVLWDGSTGKGTELTVKGEVVMDGAYLGYVSKRCEAKQRWREVLSLNMKASYAFVFPIYLLYTKQV